jgi:VWFA-related protein
MRAGAAGGFGFAMLWFCAVAQPHAGAAAADPPAPQPPVPVFPVAAELVQLDVVVTDRDGHPVPGLRREDFELLEEGRPQPVTHFAVGTAARPASLAAATGLLAPPARPAADPVVAPVVAAPAARSIVLVFDDLHIGASALSAAKLEAVRFVRDQVGPRDQVALVTTSGIRGGAQPLTRDRAAVARAVERVTLQDRSARMRFARPYISEQQAEQISQFGELATGGNDAFELAVAQFIEEYRFIGREAAEAMTRERVREILAEGARYTLASLSSLEATVRSLAPLPGRKLVVLLTQGFYLGRGTLYETAYDVRQIADAATRANVVIYSIDIGGLTVPTPAGDITERTPVDFTRRSRVEAGMDENRREGMRAVAEQTGGLAIINRNDIGKGLARILADNELYYLLAYQPTSSGRPGRFRRIEVRLPGRPGLVARTRRGYFEARPDARPRKPSPPEEAAAALRERVRDALTSIVPLGTVPVRLAADFVDLPEAGPVVVVNVGIDVADVRRRYPAAAPGAGIELVGVVTNQDGESVEQFAARVPFEETREPAGADSPGTGVVRRWLPLRPGLFQVRVAALAPGSADVGSASQWVEVPDLSMRRLALSDLFLSPAGEGGGRAGHLPASLWRRFPVGSEIDVVLYVYNATTGGGGDIDLALRFRLVRDGRLVHEFQPRPVASDPVGSPARVAGGARLSLAGLPPGEYELRAVVEDRAAAASAERGVGFTVE